MEVWLEKREEDVTRLPFMEVWLEKREVDIAPILASSVAPQVEA